MAIEILTKEKLIQHGFSKEEIKKLLSKEKFIIECRNLLATNIENKIFSESDYFRIKYFKKKYINGLQFTISEDDIKPSFPTYCIELLPEYVNRSFDYLIKKEKEKINNIFFEQKIKERFINERIEYCKNELNELNKTKLRSIVEKSIENYQNALDWFEDYKTNKLIESNLSDDNHLAVKITGYGNQNLNIIEQPVFYFIENVLKENNLTPIEAIKIVEKMKGSFSPNFNKVVTPKIIEHLESLNKYYIPEVKKTTNKKRLKVNQIALIHIYNNEIINRDNAQSIAEKNGYRSKTSGEGLFQDFTLYRSRTNRRAKTNPYTLKKQKNKIELFKSIIPFVTKQKEMLLDEIKILETHLEKHDE